MFITSTDLRDVNHLYAAFCRRPRKLTPQPAVWRHRSSVVQVIADRLAALYSQ